MAVHYQGRGALCKLGTDEEICKVKYDLIVTGRGEMATWEGTLCSTHEVPLLGRFTLKTADGKRGDIALERGKITSERVGAQWCISFRSAASLRE